MTDILCPVLELSVIIPGILLAYLPVKNYLRQTPLKLTAWLLPLLLGICILGGAVCCALQIPTRWFLFPLLPVIMLIYHKTLKISVWKSVSIFLAVFAVFTCVKSLSRAVNALMTADLHITENELWLHTGAGIFYNVICLLFVLAAWYPACHCVQTMVTDENFAQTWYVFWILPVIFIGVNLFMIPKHRSTLYTGRILQCYIVFSLVLLIILLLFYVLFLMMAVSLNKNARLQQENHFLSLQQERYENLCTAAGSKLALALVQAGEQQIQKSQVIAQGQPPPQPVQCADAAAEPAVGGAVAGLCFGGEGRLIRDHIAEHGSALLDELGAAAGAGDLDAAPAAGHPQFLVALGAAVVVVDLPVGPLLLPAAELAAHTILEGVELVVLLRPLGDVAAEGAVVAEHQQSHTQPCEQADPADDGDQQQHQRSDAQELVQAVGAIAADHEAAKFFSHSLTVLFPQDIFKRGRPRPSCCSLQG